MQNSEFISQARKILNEDYNAKHTSEYNSWLAGHKDAWRQPHMVVPFPPFVVSSALAPFKPTAVAPSESDIMAKAQELYARLNPPVSAPVAPAKPEAVVEPVAVAKPVVIEPVVVETEVAEPAVVAEPIVAKPEVVVELEVKPEVVVEPEVKPEVVDVVAKPVVAKPEVVAETITEQPVQSTIHKIFQTPAAPEVTAPPPTESSMEAFIKATPVAPQPAEVLANAIPKKTFTNVFRRLQDFVSTQKNDTGAIK